MEIKNILFAGVAMLLSTSAIAQVSYGIKAGLNLNKSSMNEQPHAKYKTFRPSYHVTGYADVNLGKQFTLQPGVSLQGKGDAYKFDGDGMTGSASWDVMSIEIPVNLVYYIPTGNSGDLFIGAGPYIGANIAGKAKVEGTGIGWGLDGERDMNFTGPDREQNLIDAGTNFLLGFKLKNGFLVNAGYCLGITDLHPEEMNDHIHNRTLSFGVGFQF